MGLVQFIATTLPLSWVFAFLKWGYPNNLVTAVICSGVITWIYYSQIRLSSYRRESNYEKARKLNFL